MSSNQEKMEKLKKRASGCKKCEISKNARNKVFGDGDYEARIIIVGEAPGSNEDKKGIPFIGRAGKKLDSLLESIDMDRSSIYITNVVKCRPPRNRDPKTTEIKHCLPYLIEEIKLVGPSVIISAGLVPFRSLTDVPPKTTGRVIREIQKTTPFTFIYNKKIPVIYMYHPSFVMRSEGTDSEKEVFNCARSDLIRAVDLSQEVEKTDQDELTLF